MSRGRLFPAALALCLLAGCAAAPPAKSAEASSAASSSAAAPAEPEKVPPVFADWSQLAPYERTAVEPLYTKFQPYQNETLTARDDYGILLPYVGAIPAISNDICNELPLYGLVTKDGRVVTEPVYADIYMASLTNGFAPFLILRKGNPTQALGGRESDAGQFSLTVAAPDGSWIREFGVAGADAIDETHLAVTAVDDSVTVIDAEGKDTALFPRSAFTPYLGEDFTFDWENNLCDLGWKDGMGYVEQLDRETGDEHYPCFLNIAEGTISETPPAGWTEEWGEPSYEKSPAVEGYRYLEKTQDSVTGEAYYYGPSPTGGVEYPNSLMDVFSEDLELVYSVRRDPPVYTLYLWDGLCASFESDAGANGVFSYYNANGTCVFRYPCRGNSE